MSDLVFDPDELRVRLHEATEAAALAGDALAQAVLDGDLAAIPLAATYRDLWKLAKRLRALLATEVGV